MISSLLLLPLIAAALHAYWNALVKSAADRLAILAFIALLTTLTGAGMLLFVEPPRPESWIFIALSISIKYMYYALTYYAYGAGDLSLVYPVSRGVAPLLVAAGAAFFADEVPQWPALLGVAIVSFGIWSLVGSRRGAIGGSGRALGLSVGIGVAIAAFSVCDGIGVRASDSPLGFMAWLFALELPIVVFMLAQRRSALAETLASSWRVGLLAGICSIVAYGLVVYAAVYVPLAIVAALRETSIIMAATIGAVLLGERSGRNRMTASVLVTCGVVLITVSQ